MALLEIRGVCKSFRTLKALESVDVDVQARGCVEATGYGRQFRVHARR